MRLFDRCLVTRLVAALALAAVGSSVQALDSWRVMNEEGVRARDTGDFKLATTKFTRAFAALSQSRATAAQLGIVQRNLAETMLRSDNPEQALEIYLQILKREEKEFGPSSPLACRTLKELALVYEKLKDKSAARSCMARRVDIHRKLLGRRSSIVRDGEQALVRLFQEEKQYDESLRLLGQRLATDQTDSSANRDRWVAEDLLWMGINERLQGKLPEAEAFFLRSQETAEKIAGKYSPEIVKHLAQRGILALEQNRAADAVSLLERAVAIQESQQRRQGPCDPVLHFYLTQHLHALAYAYLRLNQPQRAKLVFEKELKVLDGNKSSPRLDLMAARAGIACCHLMSRRFSQSLAVVTEAESLLKSEETARLPGAVLRLYRAMALFAMSRPGEAAAAAKQAADALRRRDEQGPISFTEVATQVNFYRLILDPHLVRLLPPSKLLAQFYRQCAQSERALGRQSQSGEMDRCADTVEQNLANGERGA